MSLYINVCRSYGHLLFEKELRFIVFLKLTAFHSNTKTYLNIDSIKCSSMWKLQRLVRFRNVYGGI